MNRLILAIFLLLVSVYTWSAQKSVYPTNLYIDTSGTKLLIEGMIAAKNQLLPGQEHYLVRALRKAPGTIKSVHLNLHGADLEASMDVARLIKQKGWQTHVQAHCFGGCTLLLAAGSERSSAPDASLIFRPVRWFENNKLCMNCRERLRRQALVNSFLTDLNTPAALVLAVEQAEVEMLPDDDRLRGFLNSVEPRPFAFAGRITFLP